MDPEPKTRCTPLRSQFQRKRDGAVGRGSGGWGNEPLTAKAHLSARGTGGGGDFVVRVFPIHLDCSGLHQSA